MPSCLRGGCLGASIIVCLQFDVVGAASNVHSHPRLFSTSSAIMYQGSSMSHKFLRFGDDVDRITT